MDEIGRVKIRDHELVKVVRDFLSEREIEAADIENNDVETCVSWKLKYEEVEIMIMVYDVGKSESEIFLWVQTVVCRLDQVKPQEVMEWLLKQNYDFPHPMKFALSDNSEAIFLMMRVFDKWITKEHLKFRLDKLGPFVVEMQDRLKRRFGLRPFREGEDVMTR